jgi:hypothetical protein
MPRLTTNGIIIDDGVKILVSYAFQAYINNNIKVCNFYRCYDSLEEIEPSSVLYKKAVHDILENPLLYLGSIYKYDACLLQDKRNNFLLDPQIKDFKISIYNELEDNDWWFTDKKMHKGIDLTKVFNFDFDEETYKIQHLTQTVYDKGNHRIQFYNVDYLKYD